MGSTKHAWYHHRIASTEQHASHVVAKKKIPCGVCGAGKAQRNLGEDPEKSQKKNQAQAANTAEVVPGQVQSITSTAGPGKAFSNHRPSRLGHEHLNMVLPSCPPTTARGGGGGGIGEEKKGAKAG